MLGKSNLLFEINFPNKHPTQNAEIKILKRNSFPGEKYNIFFYAQIII